MKCSNCGYDNEKEALFCLKCGKKLETKPEENPQRTDSQKTGKDGGKCSCLRYILAFVACVGVYFAWIAMGVLVFEWKHGGGIIPTLILFAILGGVWRTITHWGR